MIRYLMFAQLPGRFEPEYKYVKDNRVEWISDRDVAMIFTEKEIDKYRHLVDAIANVKTRLELA